MEQRPLSPIERRDWLRLSRTENVGPVIFRQLISRFGSARAALEALPDIAKRGGKRIFVVPAATVIEDEIEAMEKAGGKVIGLCEPDYPQALAAIEDAPPLLSVLGNAALLHKRSIGIVGARNASLNGRKITETLARELGGRHRHRLGHGAGDRYGRACSEPAHRHDCRHGGRRR